MTKEDIIRMAREEAKKFGDVTDEAVVFNDFDSFDDATWSFNNFAISFAAVIAAAERKECAKVCDAEATEAFEEGTEEWARGACMCAAAIRARSKKGE